MLSFLAGALACAVVALLLVVKYLGLRVEYEQMKVRKWREHFETLAFQIDGEDGNVIVAAAESRIDAELRESA